MFRRRLRPSVHDFSGRPALLGLIALVMVGLLVLLTVDDGALKLRPATGTARAMAAAAFHPAPVR